MPSSLPDLAAGVVGCGHPSAAGLEGCGGVRAFVGDRSGPLAAVGTSEAELGAGEREEEDD